MATALTFAAGLQSLANSTTVGQASAEVDLSADSTHKDVIVQMSHSTAAGSPTGTVDIYVLTSLAGTVYDGDTSYSGTAASYTLGAAGSQNLTKLGSMKMHAAATLYSHTWSLFGALGFRPIWFSIVVVNASGLALASSGQGGSYDFPVV